MPWYSPQGSLDALFTGRPVGMILMVCCLRHGDRVFEAYWTTGRGCCMCPAEFDVRWHPDRSTNDPALHL